MVSIRYHEKIEIINFLMSFYFLRRLTPLGATPSKGGVLEINTLPICLGWLLL